MLSDYKIVQNVIILMKKRVVQQARKLDEVRRRKFKL